MATNVSRTSLQVRAFAHEGPLRPHHAHSLSLFACSLTHRQLYRDCMRLAKHIGGKVRFIGGSHVLVCVCMWLT